MKNKKRGIFKIALWAMAIGLGAYIGISFFFYPDVAALKRKNPTKTAFMEYREQEWRQREIHRHAEHRFVPLSEISPMMIKAVLIAEDDKFGSHDGFDFKAMVKALEKDIRKKKIVAGGSTISQQLAKNLFLSPSKNPARKIKEAILTWRLENNLSKRRIMELYLNYAEWGEGLFGVEMAAQYHFTKHASQLSAKEAAKLAAVLPNPRRMDPVGNSSFVINRAQQIYDIMVMRGIIIPDYEDIGMQVQPTSETP